MTTTPPPTFAAETAPRDALRDALAWLAEVVPDVSAPKSQALSSVRAISSMLPEALQSGPEGD